MSREIKTDNTVSEEIATGVKILTDIVKITLGPKGKNVVIETKTGPMIVNDGVTIAKEVFIENKLNNLGAQMAKEVCLRSDEEEGDGTTTGLVIAQKILEEGFKSIQANKEINVHLLKNALNKYAGQAVDLLNGIKRDIKTDAEMLNVAMISSGGDKEGSEMIVKAFNEIKRVGHVVVRDGRNYDLELEVVKGMVYDQGLPAKVLINNANGTFFREKCMVAYVMGEITDATDVIPLLELASSMKKGLLIIAQSIKGGALGVIIENKNHGFCAVNAPGPKAQQKEFMEDMIAVTGGTILNLENGKSVSDVWQEDFGHTDLLEVFTDKFVLQRDIPESEMTRFDDHVKTLKKEAARTKDEYFKDLLSIRLAKLIGGFAVIFAGARGEIASHERKLRLEDAVKSVRTALKNGYLPGGGIGLKFCSDKLSEMTKDTNLTIEEAQALRIMIIALEEPLCQIVENCGYDPVEIVKQLDRLESVPGDFNGYDAKKNRIVCMVKNGIIDPANVTMSSLLNGTSVAGIILTTGGSITINGQEPEKNPLFG